MGPHDLASRVLEELSAKRATLAVAESCTGGLLCSTLTDVPGSSESFILGVVSYSDGAKRDILDVPPEDLERFGAISPQVAGAMASGVRHLSGSDLGLGVTGAAGPSAPEGVEVGTVISAVAWKSGLFTRVNDIGGDRRSVKEGAVKVALDHLLEVLTGG
jgi:PncC family amidohydrolase